MAAVRRRPGPCNGRSETISACGGPLPAYTTSPQADAGRTASRAGLPAADTHTPSSATASPAGPARAPAAVAWFVAGSMRCTWPSTVFVAHTAAGPAATHSTPRPTWMGVSCGSGRGSMRQTLPPSGSAAQTAPAPTASVVRKPASTSMRRETLFDVGSTSTRTLSSMTQTAPSAAATPRARAPATVATTRLVRGSMRTSCWSWSTTQIASSVAAMSCWLTPPPSM